MMWKINFDIRNYPFPKTCKIQNPTHTGIRMSNRGLNNSIGYLWISKRDMGSLGKRIFCVVNAPTGSGKTYSVLLAVLADYIENHKKDAFTAKPNQLKLIWITPIKALAKEILISSEKALQALGLPWNAEIRTGDSTAKDRAHNSNHHQKYSLLHQRAYMSSLPPKVIKTSLLQYHVS
ncbi:MAG: DEAD/DEAH box helicase [Saprospiraceae bacterium]|nr:DEAD/DEAH box helicase [Saprospiraceae bacterium]